MSETVIEKTFIFHQPHSSLTNANLQVHEAEDDEHLDEVIVYSYETTETNENHQQKSFYENELIFDDDSYRVFNTQTDETDSLMDESLPNESSFQAAAELTSHENLSVITEESSFVEELNSNEENNSIRILYDLIKKPHWTKTIGRSHLSHGKPLSSPSTLAHSKEENTSISSNPSSLSLDSISGNQSDDEDEYDQEKGRQLIQRLIEETLARRWVKTLLFLRLLIQLRHL